MSFVYQAVYPIGDTDPTNLPVPDLTAALPFYENGLGFVVEARIESPVPQARLRRDGVVITLAENGGNPEQASCYFAVSDVYAAHMDCRERGLAPTALRDDHGGNTVYRVFFVQAPDGLCFCLGQKVGVEQGA